MQMRSGVRGEGTCDEAPRTSFINWLIDLFITIQWHQIAISKIKKFKK